MVKSSRVFSDVVYIRNVTANLEKYSFDLEMLEIFYAVNGSKTVGEVAAELGKSVTGLKPAFERLSKQKLILAAPRILTDQAGRSAEEVDAETPKNVSSEEGASREGPRPVQPSIMEEPSTIPSAERGHTEASSRETVVEGQPPADGRPEDVEMDFLDLDVLISEVSSIDEESGEGRHMAVDDTAAEELWQESAHTQVELREAFIDDLPENDPFPDVDPQETEPGPEPGDLFSYIKPVESPPSTLFDSFARARADRSEEDHPETPFTKSRKTASTGFAGFAGFGSPLEEVEQEPAREADPPLNAKGIEHFENGLAALQGKLYKEALVQFELASELDPENRLCKANIQRIRKILEDEAS